MTVNNYSSSDLRFSQQWLWRMPSSGMWRCVHLVWTDVSEERIGSIFRVEKFSHLLARGFLYPEDRGDTFLRNVGSHKIYTAPHPRRRHSSNILLFTALATHGDSLEKVPNRSFYALNPVWFHGDENNGRYIFMHFHTVYGFLAKTTWAGLKKMGDTEGKHRKI
jgi:hypothetical protein